MNRMIEITRGCQGDNGEVLKAGEVVEVRATLANGLIGSNKAVPVDGESRLYDEDDNFPEDGEVDDES